jgi:hypothetical protein
MSDPRLTDPGYNNPNTDPRLSDPVLRRDESAGGIWGWVAGLAVLALIAFIVVAGWNNNGTTANNAPNNPPVTTGSATPMSPPSTTTGSGSMSPRPAAPAPSAPAPSGK